MRGREKIGVCVANRVVKSTREKSVPFILSLVTEWAFSCSRNAGSPRVKSGSCARAGSDTRGAKPRPIGDGVQSVYTIQTREVPPSITMVTKQLNAMKLNAAPERKAK